MKRKIITTQDGSKTIQIEEWNEQYHSVHGAIQEAQHVYIKKGLHYFCSKYNTESHDNISILEIGFGTGLNAYMSLLEANELSIRIDYVGVEAFPVLEEELSQLNYSTLLKIDHGTEVFKKLHTCTWEKKHAIVPNFSLLKKKILFSEIKDINSYNIIYFDAFGARVQPELWTESIFTIVYNALRKLFN